MPRGGRRPGSGRKPGSGNKKRSAALVRKQYESGEKVPLEVMLDLMRYFAEKAARQTTEGECEAALKEAGMWAQAAAPYMHARLAAIDARTTLQTGDTLSALLKAIDGSTTGIAQGLLADDLDGELALEADEPIHVRH